MPSQTPSHEGFDAPVTDAAHDYLNRWPLARQIYTVAADGSIDWSVRIGVYGEWGTGKTSVLKFVSSMADQDDHIVVWFDPWAYTDQTDMWRAYVRAIHQAALKKLGAIPETKALREDGWLAKGLGQVPRFLKCWKKEVGELASDGLTWLRGYFHKRSEALRDIRNVLTGKRVIVFIDDLDRTAAELVPDILYALKEVMDIPGFSFICGFDPSVVGKVLRARHRAFGDGLKFLEKIIDYPVWLPPIKQDGLVRIALNDAKQFCRLAPIRDLEDTLAYLPPNPRSIRQFVRLLALLKSQTDRYYDHELRWSVILASTALKVHYPKVADALLLHRPFWDLLSAREPTDAGSSTRQERDLDVERHIEKSFSSQCLSVSLADKNLIERALLSIGKNIALWSRDDVGFVLSQISITEQPQAVTWKEFDALIATLDETNVKGVLKAWIIHHAQQQHHRETAIANELCMAAVDRYRSDLKQADTAFDQEAALSHQKSAAVVFRLLETLTLELGDEISSLQDRKWIPLKYVISKLAALSSATSSAHANAWRSTESFLLRLAREQYTDIEILISTITELHRDRSDYSSPDRLISQLEDIWRWHMGNVILAGLCLENFMHNVLSGFSKIIIPHEIFWESLSPVEGGHRSDLLAVLKEAGDNPNVQSNAYELTKRLTKMLVPRENQKNEIKLFKDEEMLIAIWNATTARQFAARHVYSVRTFPSMLEENGIPLKLPAWWESSIKEYESTLAASAGPLPESASTDSQTKSSS